MRIPYPIEYYEDKLFYQYKKEYQIILFNDNWHGLRTWVKIRCNEHKTSRIVYLKKVFNGSKSTRPCRQCYLDTLRPTDHPPTEKV